MKYADVKGQSIEDYLCDPGRPKSRPNRQYTGAYIHKCASQIVRDRDGGMCVGCGAPGVLMHHQDYDKTNNTLDNLVWLCRTCHAAVHAKIRQFGSYRVTPGSEVRGFNE